MLRTNLFDGESCHAKFARITYKRLISRNWVTYADIMAEYMKLYSAKELPYLVSKCVGYGELKKAFRNICNSIINRVGKDCFEVQGNIRNKAFRYIGADNDPLADMKNAKVVKDLRKYWKFCQDSAGFFPTSWLDYYFKDCKDLLDIKAKKRKGEQVLSASLDRKLKNIEYLPLLYDAITKRQVLSINYQPYEEECVCLTFHPQYLKEFNGRWHLFGHVEDAPPKYPEDGCNLAIDRIEGKPREIYNKPYISAPAGFYSDFFKDILGVSHSDDRIVYNLRVRAHNPIIFKLTETKPIHTTQDTIVPFGEHEDGTYGEFSVRVEINNEFIGRILQMGAGLEIIAPQEAREIFRERVQQLAKLYTEKT